MAATDERDFIIKEVADDKKEFDAGQEYRWGNKE